MITAATLCPWPPLLVRELTGIDPVLPDLRDACAAAVADLLRSDLQHGDLQHGDLQHGGPHHGRPDAVAVVAPGPATTTWPADGRLNVAAFGGGPAPGAGVGHGRPALPPAAGIGAYLLDQAGYQGPRMIWTVSEEEPPAGCRKLGAELAAAGPRTALLVLGDGSARRGPNAPGAFDPRAAAFDAEVARAVRDADLDALLAIDPALARDLMATGRPAWQVLAGALAGRAPAADVRYAGDPFGVLYLVTSFHWAI